MVVKLCVSTVHVTMLWSRESLFQWMVTPDWEEVMGLVHNLYHIADSDQPDLAVLKMRFKDEPLYLDVIDTIIGLSSRDATV